MTIDEAIAYCADVIEECKNTRCTFDHIQLKKWLIELKMYRKKYGILEEMHPSITITKSNLHKESIHIDDIVYYTVNIGIYEGVQYHTKIYCKNHTYYVVESEDDIAKMIEEAKNSI